MKLSIATILFVYKNFLNILLSIEISISSPTISHLLTSNIL